VVRPLKGQTAPLALKAGSAAWQLESPVIGSCNGSGDPASQRADCSLGA